MFSSTLLHAQSGQKWSVDGNTISSGDFIGSTNPYPFLVKTNNLDRFLINPNGKLFVMDFKNLGLGFVTFNNNGKLIPQPFSGNATDVLTGNGTFQSIAIVSGWKQIGFDLVNTNTANVGIGTSTPTEKLSVVGNILNDGFLLTRGISIIGRGQGERLNADTMQTNIMLMDTLSKIEGETRIVGNASVSEKFGIGTKYPTEALEIVGNSVINGNNVVRGSITGNTVNAGDLFLSNIQREQILTTNLSGQIVPMSQSLFQVLAFSAGPILKQCDTTGFQMAWVSSDNKMWADMPGCARVGIGTTNPQFTLDVVGSAHISEQLKIGNNSLYLSSIPGAAQENNIYSTNGDLILQSSSKTTQNVGIGIGEFDQANAKLDVQVSKANSWVGNFNNSAGDGYGVNIWAGSGSAGGPVLQCRSGDGGGRINYLLQVNTIAASGGKPARGYVGIGTPNPDCSFHVETSDEGNWTACFDNGWGDGKGVKIKAGAGSGAKEAFLVTDNYNVNLFMVHSGTRTCYAREIVTKITAWPDYVFDKKYDLPSIEDKRKEMLKAKHLPYLPSAKKIEADGANIGNTLIGITQNTEELYLYLFQQQETIKELSLQLEEIRRELNSLRKNQLK